MSQRRDVPSLLRSGIEEARLGNYDTARDLLKQVVERDPANEKGWLWLASVTDDEDEKLIYLERTLEINPYSEAAQRALDKIVERQHGFGEEGDVIAGVGRRQFVLVLGAGALLIAVVAGVVAVVLGNQNQRQAEVAATTQAAQAMQTETAVQVAALLATESAATAAALATQQAGPTETPTMFIPLRTLVPTWTPTATATDPFGAFALLPMPEGLIGTLAGWSGRDIQSVDYLPVGGFNLANGAFQAATSGIGRDVRLHPNAQRIVYSRYDQTTTFDAVLETVNLNGSEPETLSERWRSFGGPLSAEMPDWSPDGNQVVFVAAEPDTLAQQLYILDLQQTSAQVSPLRRLTNDRANYSYPAFSPDGSRILAVRDDLTGAVPGPDVVILDIATLQLTPLTSDFGAFVESAPRWSPDGQLVVYAAAPSTDPDNRDIAIRNSAGFGLPTLPVRDPADDFLPVYSPDGRYLAFTSNRSGNYDLFIFDFTTQSLAQLTNSVEEDYVGGWR